MTKKKIELPTFVLQVNPFKIIAITHKKAPLELIGKLHLDENNQQQGLERLKQTLELKELMYLSTCNRVEFILNSEKEIDEHFLKDVFLLVNNKLTREELQELILFADVYKADEALNHLFEVSASLDSLVVGEREIITQVRKAYESCNLLGLTGDTIRLAIKQTIETAKQVYTDTDIAKNPVSVVSLAYRQLRNLGIKNNARILFVGAGETNTTMAKYLKKHQYSNFTVFNRTLANGSVLAKELKGEAVDLKDIKNFNKGFDVLITCTSSQDPIITKELYERLLNNETSKKVVIDLALPSDVDKSVVQSFDFHYIDIESLKKQASENLLKREAEVEKCKDIIAFKVNEFKTLYHERKVELAFGEVPKQIKFIKESALNDVFYKEIELLDPQSKEVLEKVLSYMEKKCNALTIKTAKKVLLKNDK